MYLCVSSFVAILKQSLYSLFCFLKISHSCLDVLLQVPIVVLLVKFAGSLDVVFATKKYNLGSCLEQGVKGYFLSDISAKNY